MFTQKIWVSRDWNIFVLWRKVCIAYRSQFPPGKPSPRCSRPQWTLLWRRGSLPGHCVVFCTATWPRPPVTPHTLLPGQSSARPLPATLVPAGSEHEVGSSALLCARPETFWNVVCVSWHKSGNWEHSTFKMLSCLTLTVIQKTMTMNCRWQVCSVFLLAPHSSRICFIIYLYQIFCHCNLYILWFFFFLEHVCQYWQRVPSSTALSVVSSIFLPIWFCFCLTRNWVPKGRGCRSLYEL